MTTRADTKRISQEYELAHAPAKVWRALTEPALVEKWLMSTDMKPVVGQSFIFKTQPMPWWDGIVNCEVLEVVPQKRLSYTWRSGPETSPLDTVVTWTLTPTKSGGTTLALEHSGFAKSNANAFGGASDGWKRMAGQKLGEVLAQTA